MAAGDGRAALELAEEVRTQRSRLSADLLLRPAHVPVGGPAQVAWLVRSASDEDIPASPNDTYLAEGGWQLAATRVIAGAYGDLTVQRWTR